MCGRYTLRKGFAEVATDKGSYRIKGASWTGETIKPRFNIAPTQQNWVLRKAPGEAETLEAAMLRWGLIPSWSKTARPPSPMINARSESVAEKPSFKAAFQRRRCLVPADGYYEWKKQRGGSQPYFFHMQDDSVFFMAGIWDAWISESGDEVESYTILTTQPNSITAKFHDRMPVILPPERIARWMNGDLSQLSAVERDELFAPLDSETLLCQPANPIVNNNRNEGPECIEAPATVPVSQLDLGL